MMFSGLPPTYESLYGEFQQVEDPKGLAQFIAKVFAVIISTSESCLEIRVFIEL